MSSLSQKAGYLKGLADSAGLKDSDIRDRLLKGLVDALSDVAEELDSFTSRDMTATEVVMKSMTTLIESMASGYHDEDIDEDDDDFDEDDDDFDDDDVDYFPHFLTNISGDDEDDEEDEEDEEDDEEDEVDEDDEDVIGTVELMQFLRIMSKAERPTSFSVRCPNCRVTSIFKASTAGETVPCPSCGADVEVPTGMVICRSCHNLVMVDPSDLRGDVVYCPDCGKSILG